MPDHDYDVIVSGAGPAGSTTAIQLARAGVRVALIERARFPREKPCGGGITGRCLTQAPVDLSPVIEHKVSRVRFSFRLGEFFDYDYPETLVYMTQRVRLDAYLASQAAVAGAELIEGVQVKGVRQEAGAVHVETERGTLSAKVIVGADGSNGAVARSLGLQPVREAPVALEANFSYSGSNGGGPPAAWRGVLALELGSMSGGYGWSFPKADHFNIGCGGFKSEGGRLRSHLSDLARHYGLDAGGAENVRGHHLPTREGGRPIARGNALLVGDAAGLVDPMSGEGIFSAFVSGRLAASAIGPYLEGRTPDVMHYEAAIERELMPDIRAAAMLRDAYHYLPGLSYQILRRFPYLRKSLCRLMLGEISYDGFMRQGGPIRPVVAAVAAIGRRRRAAAAAQT